MLALVSSLSSLLSPLSSAEAVGLEPTSEMDSPPVFKTGPSSSRMTSVIVSGLALATGSLDRHSQGEPAASAVPLTREARSFAERTATKLRELESNQPLNVQSVASFR